MRCCVDIAQEKAEWGTFRDRFYECLKLRPPHDPTETKLGEVVTEDEAYLATNAQLEAYPRTGPSSAVVQREIEKRMKDCYYVSTHSTDSSSEDARVYLAIRYVLGACFGEYYQKSVLHTTGPTKCLQRMTMVLFR